MIEPSNQQQLQQATLEEIKTWIDFIQGPACSIDSYVKKYCRGYGYRCIGHELIRRLSTDERNETLALLESILSGSNQYLHPLLEVFSCHGDNSQPWHTDVELWYQLAEVLCRKEKLPSRSSQSPGNTQRLSEWLQQKIAVGNLEILYVIRRESTNLIWPGITTEQRLAVIDWAINATTSIDFGFYQQHRITDLAEDISPLLHDLNDQHFLALVDTSKLVRAGIFYLLRKRGLNSGYDWTPWLDYMEKHPKFYWLYDLQDSLLIERLWPQASADQRVDMVRHFADLLKGYGNKNNQKTSIIFERLLQDDSQPFVSYLKRQIESGGTDNIPLGRLIWTLQSPELVPLLLPVYAGNFGFSRHHYEDKERNPVLLMQEILFQQPELIATVPGNKVASLLNMLSDEILNLCLPALTDTIKSSNSKELRLFLKNRADALQPEQLEACGWVKKPNKNLMLVARDVLLAHSDPKAGLLLEKLLATGKLDAGSASQVETRLIQLGLREPLSGEAQLQQMKTLLASVKRIGKAVEQAATPDLVAHMSPLSPQAAKAVLQLVYSADDELPPLVHQALSYLSAEQPAKLMPYLLESWIACDGDPKQRWVLRLLKGNADDRLVDLLFDAVRSWNKPRGPRAVMATEHLAEIDSLYALMRVQEISETRRYRDSVIDKARTCLRQAAQRRDMTTDELFDELTPDFGLADEKGFLIGDKSYRIELQGDLTLRIINDKGKATKSVPKPRDASLLEAWEDAKARLKILNSNLKTVVKRQGPRMEESLLCSKQWPTSRWQRLFVQHPLLQVVGQSLIWQTDDGQSFRISEDRSLVDVNDEVVELTDGQPIRLWYPIHGKEGEREQWQEYLADYELEPMVVQLDAPNQLPTPEQMNDHQILAPQKLTVMQGPLASLLKKLSYRQGPVTDGPQVECHYINLDSAEYCIKLNHYDYLPWMELDQPVMIEGISVSPSADGYRSQPLNPVELPSVLQATLLDHLKQIEALV